MVEEQNIGTNPLNVLKSILAVPPLLEREISRLDRARDEQGLDVHVVFEGQNAHAQAPGISCCSHQGGASNQRSSSSPRSISGRLSTESALSAMRKPMAAQGLGR